MLDRAQVPEVLASELSDRLSRVISVEGSFLKKFFHFEKQLSVTVPMFCSLFYCYKVLGVF